MTDKPSLAVEAHIGVAFVADVVFEALQTTLQNACSWDWVPFRTVEYSTDGDVMVGVLPLVGDLPCQLRLVFRPQMAEQLSRSFFGFEIPADSEDMLDMIGEISNVVAGEVVARLAARGASESISLPAVFRGDDFEFPGADGHEETWAAFRTPDGEFLCGVVSGAPSEQRSVQPFEYETLDELLEQITGVVRESVVEITKDACHFEDASAVFSRPIPPINALIGILAFAGTAPWQLRMVFRYEEAERIATSFTGMLITQDSDDMPDAIGEIVNVVAGDVSARLAERGVQAQLSVPTVLRGEHVELPIQKGISVYRLLVATPVGAFWVEVLNEQ